ncbi:MAG: ATP-binding cassette domain-containing protein [Anaerolineae bacterium]|nr:ATP-binding cassette domain-containing protein [Anaerolineae bacterium]
MNLEANGLCFAYHTGKPVLKDISLAVQPDQILYVLGPNGCGKSTLLSCLSGIRKPDQGSILLDGIDLFSIAPEDRARKIGLIPQTHVPAFAYTVRDMVLMGRAPHLGLFDSPRRADYEIADQSLESVQLSHLRDRPYTELSGGERQLVMIARGLAQQCPIMLMDEPDAHLDPQNQHRVLELVAQLSGQGVSFVIASHSPNNALFYADRVLLMKDGASLAYGKVSDILTEPLLSTAYELDMAVIGDVDEGIPVPRAIVPRRPTYSRMEPDDIERLETNLAKVFADGQESPQLIIVTGQSGSGKSTWCKELSLRAKGIGLSIGGILSPAVFENGEKTGIDLINLADGSHRRLAGQRQGTSSGVTTPRWQFDEATLDWGNIILGNLPPTDLVIIDELGPLEFRRGMGLQNGLRVIDERAHPVMCVVVRPSLLSDARKRWPHGLVMDVSGKPGDGRK